MVPRISVLTAGTLALWGTVWVPGERCILNERQQLTAWDATGSENFGASVSVSGSWALVGAWRDSDRGPNAGSAYVFRRDDSGTPSDPGDDLWVDAGALTGLDTSAGDRFGRSASISNAFAVVGAIFDVDGGTRSGSAYVFRRDDNGTPSDFSDDVWVETAKLTASDGAEFDQFGASVSIDDDRVVIGAFNHDEGCPPDNPNCNSGSAYVFRHDDNDTPRNPEDDFWVEEDKLVASDLAAGDSFGVSVSISGDRAVVGAFLSDAAAEDAGAAYVFRRDDNGTPLDPGDDFWVEEDRLTASDAGVDDAFGFSVFISGDRAVVGSPSNDARSADAGAAYVFRRDNNATPFDPSDDFWVEEAMVTASDPLPGNEFGGAVAIVADRIVVGSRFDDAAGADAGSAYAFRRDDNGTPLDPVDDRWVQTAKLMASDAVAGDFLGVSVALSDSHALVGAWYDDDAADNAGAVYLFSLASACADLTDFAHLQVCFTDEGGELRFGCDGFDLDGDGDIDAADYARFLLTFSGP